MHHAVMRAHPQPQRERRRSGGITAGAHHRPLRRRADDRSAERREEWRARRESSDRCVLGGRRAERARGERGGRGGFAGQAEEREGLVVIIVATVKGAQERRLPAEPVFEDVGGGWLGICVILVGGRRPQDDERGCCCDAQCRAVGGVCSATASKSETARRPRQTNCRASRSIRPNSNESSSAELKAAHGVCKPVASSFTTAKAHGVALAREEEMEKESCC